MGINRRLTGSQFRNAPTIKSQFTQILFYQMKIICMVIGEEIAKGQEGTFWSDGNILYCGWGGVYTVFLSKLTEFYS